MLQFKQNETSATIILTLSENVTINDVYYLFYFKHELTKSEVKFIIYEGQDESQSQERFNQFTINAATLFNNQPTGEWHYTVYEQSSSTNLDASLTGNPLEFGKLILEKSQNFEFTKYNPSTNYIAYNG
jgi:hypothetical protein